LSNNTILPSGTRGENLTNLFLASLIVATLLGVVAYKAKSAGIALATASIFNAVGCKKKATKITYCDRGEYK